MTKSPTVIAFAATAFAAISIRTIRPMAMIAPWPMLRRLSVTLLLTAADS